MKKRNTYLERKLARKLPTKIQKEVMFAAREHMAKAKNCSWSIPDRNSLLLILKKDQLTGANRIWFDVVVLGSKQGNHV